jgi:hypothetical protein
MLNNVGFSQVNFSGRSFRFSKGEEFSKPFKKGRDSFRELPGVEFVDAYRSNLPQFTKQISLKKQHFGYKTETSSPLELYSGPIQAEAGFSTEAKGGYGGCWLEGTIDTPLSTRDIHSCAGINLVDEASGKQFLYHVYHDTSADVIKDFLEAKFPTFNKVNIALGDELRTQKTTNEILKAVGLLNKKAGIDFYHYPVEAPEVIAHGGKLSYLPVYNESKMRFQEVINPYIYDHRDIDKLFSRQN